MSVSRAPARSPARQLGLELLLLIGVVLVGAALRLYQLDGPALWADEGNNAFFAHQSLPDLLHMTRLTHDTDPPAHRLALSLWLALWGDGALQMRSLSVLCNLLTIPLIWFWARRLGGPKAALVAALLFSLHPMAAYYGREAKGYPFATLFVTAQSLIWAEALWRKRAPPVALWLAATLAAALALGTHYYVVLIFAAQGIALAALCCSERDAPVAKSYRRILLWWLASMAVTALLTLPWVWLTFDTASGGALGLSPGRQAWSVPQFLLEVGLTLSAGPIPRNLYRLPAMLALIGAVAVAVWRGKPGVRWPVALLMIPFVLAIPLQMAVPFFSARFLYYLLAPLAVLGGLGLCHLGRARWPLLAILALGWGLSLPGVYAPLTSVPHDLRPVAEALHEKAQPGDTLVLGYIWQEGILRSYAPELPIEYVLGWYTEANVAQRLGDLLAESQRLWLLSYRVPAQHIINTPGFWLEGHMSRMWSTRAQTHRLSLYTPLCQASEDSARVVAWDGINLHYGATPSQVSAGDWLAMPMTWQVFTPPIQPVVVFYHLVDDQGQLVAQNDGAPRNGTRLFRAMEPDEELAECRWILVPENATPGAYTLEIGLYRPRTGQRIAPFAEDPDGDMAVVLADIQVVGD